MYNPIPMFTPTSDRVLVRKYEPTETSGGILLHPSSKMQFERGEVIKTGPGRLLESGKRIPVACEEGDTVLYSGTSAADIRIGKETLWLMTESAILGVVPRKPPFTPTTLPTTVTEEFYAKLPE